MERRKIFIATKTYPSISTKYKETVCTAGILLDENENPLQWIRIYPVKFRYLEIDQKYPRWSIISANIEKNHKDNRTESFRIDYESIEFIRKIETDNSWHERKKLVLPFEFRSIKDIESQGKSLGIIKPKTIESSFVKPTDRHWPLKQQAVLDQTDLFEETRQLDKIPYKFGYKFHDRDNLPHSYSISDWEISQLYRNCRKNAQSLELSQQEAEAIQKVTMQLDGFKDKKDLYFIVGNLQQYPNSFMIIGLFYPPIVELEQLTLF